jgi:hypothetical protein
MKQRAALFQEKLCLEENTVLPGFSIWVADDEPPAPHP